MIVQQIYAGWKGIVVDGIVYNGSTSYPYNKFPDIQLSKCTITPKEIDKIINELKESKPVGYFKVIEKLKALKNQ
ncbi:MAG: hypothetical protein BGO41_01430 [Clostridiales bacterium 38-18]|nr:MAG: hypothetical protein BGO41_01430 [Clostridiales bacterium 38-18]